VKRKYSMKMKRRKYVPAKKLAERRRTWCRRLKRNETMTTSAVTVFFCYQQAGDTRRAGWGSIKRTDSVEEEGYYRRNADLLQPY
jgi:cobalamin-dependent methionine synthase I